MILTYRYRLKEPRPAIKELARQARAVNVVWNFCGETQEAARRWNKPWPSGYDLIGLTNGVSREIGLHSDTVQAVCKQFANSRDAHRRRPRWRGKRSLGWIPFQAARAIRVEGDAAIFLKRRYRLWMSRKIDGEIRSGHFAQDARGHWYLNLHLELAERSDCGSGEVGIDLGLKHLATLSTGEKIANAHHLARHAAKLAIAQRAGRKHRARALNAKIAHCRRHFLHQLSRRLVRENRLISVGNVNASRLAKTKMAKSVLDAGWSQLRSQLRYKAIRHGAQYLEVDERFTTQVCSGCGAVSGPKGIADLGVRDWVCVECGVSHDRDVNSAINILVSGRNAVLQLTEIPALQGGEAVKAVSYSNMPSKELTAALEAARAAEAVIRALFGRNPAVRTKPDQSPVTEADLRAEELIRATLSRHFPAYGFFGEETGQHAMQAENIWLVDPIDGTKSFVRESPFFSTQIALMRAGKLVLGVSNAPAFGELAWAEEGAGAWLNERMVHVSTVADLGAAAISSGNLKSLARSPRWQRYGELVARAHYSRGYGDFAHYHMLARGALDVVIESDLNILDIAALAVIVREAGGTFTDLEGRAVGLGTTSVLATNGRLHGAVLEALAH